MPLILSSMGRQRPRRRATSTRRPAFAISRTTPSTRCSFPCRDDSLGTRMGRLSRPRHPRQRNRPHGPDRRGGGNGGRFNASATTAAPSTWGASGARRAGPGSGARCRGGPGAPTTRVPRGSSARSSATSSRAGTGPACRSRSSPGRSFCYSCLCGHLARTCGLRVCSVAPRQAHRARPRCAQAGPRRPRGKAQALKGPTHPCRIRTWQERL